MKTTFTARRLYTPTEEISDPVLVVEDGLITDVGSLSAKPVAAGTSIVDFGDAILAPGFLDIPIHGGAGMDVMRTPPADLPRVAVELTATPASFAAKS